MVDPKPELFRSSKGTEIAELHGNNIFVLLPLKSVREKVPPPPINGSFGQLVYRNLNQIGNLFMQILFPFPKILYQSLT